MAVRRLARGWMAAVPFAALGICCGARSELEVSTGAPDASDAAQPSLTPCEARDYANDLYTDVFAVTNEFVYFTLNGSWDGPWGLYRVPKDGSAADRQLILQFFLHGGGYVDYFVADDSFVWWVGANGYLTRMAVAGGAKETIGPADGCCAVASAAGQLLVGKGPPFYVVPKDGGTPIALSKDAPIHAPVHDVAMDNLMALWSTDERVYGDKLDGTDPSPVGYADWPGAVALHGGFMYWTRRVSGTWHLERQQEGDGQQPTELSADGISRPLGANDAFVYGGRTQGGVAKVPTTGGGPSTVVVPGGVDVTRVVVDGACLYFVEGKSLHRVPG